MSKLTVYERAYLYVAKCPAAISESGGHNATFTVACALVKGFDLTIDEARPIMREYNGRCQPPWSEAEIEHKLKQADTRKDERERGWLRDAEGPERNDGPREPRLPSQAPSVALPEPKPIKPEFNPEALRVFASRWRPFVNTLWLADRSPIAPRGLSTEEFLRAVFREGEKVVVFTNQQSQGQALWPVQPLPSGGDDGVWFLGQPVDGHEHINPRSPANEDGSPKMSRRSEESVVDWRHLVLESDEADAKDWIAALVNLPLPIVAIYTSGGRSIHALVKVSAKSKQDWDNIVKQVRPELVTLGADSKAMSAVRLTRLPGCMRGSQLQKLLYLNPDPVVERICLLKPVRDSLEEVRSVLPQVLGVTPEDIRNGPGWEVIDQMKERLVWYESAPEAREILAKLRAWEETDQ